MIGTVIKRGKTWTVVIEGDRTPEGKRLRKWHGGFSTKREAEAARAKLVNQMNEGTYVEPTKGTLADWLGPWLENGCGLAGDDDGGLSV